MAGWVGRLNKLNLISTQVEVLVEVGVEQYVAVVEAGADLQYTSPDGLRTMADRRVEVIIMLSHLLDVVVAQAGWS